MTGKYVWIGLAVGPFFAGLGVGYAVFINTYNPYAMMGNRGSVLILTTNDTELLNAIQ